MKIESNKNWTTCLRLNTGDGSPRVFLLNSHFLGSVPREKGEFFRKIMEPRGVEPLSKYIDTIKSTFIVYLFKFRYRLADKQASS